MHSGGGPKQASAGHRPRRFRRVRPGTVLAVVLLTVLAAMVALPQLFTRTDPQDCDLALSDASPSLAHPLGVDTLGCDYLTHAVYGARTSLSIVGITVLATALVALVLGAVAGYFGGWADVLISRATDVWMSIPLILGGIVVLSATDDRGVVEVAVVLSLFGWPAMARLVRTSVLTARTRDHVLAARALGAGSLRILGRHVLPLSLRPLLAYASAYAGIVVAAEATLTFVGAGLQLPAVSWGIMLYRAQDRVLTAPHLLLVPAAFLVVAVLGFVLLGEALRRRTDERRA